MLPRQNDLFPLARESLRTPMTPVPPVLERASQPLRLSDAPGDEPVDGPSQKVGGQAYALGKSMSFALGRPQMAHRHTVSTAILVASLTLVASGCGGVDDPGNNPSAQATPTRASPTPTPTESSSPTPDPDPVARASPKTNSSPMTGLCRFGSSTASSTRSFSVNRRRTRMRSARPTSGSPSTLPPGTTATSTPSWTAA